LLEPERNLEVLTRLVAHFEQHVDDPLYLDQEIGARMHQLGRVVAVGSVESRPGRSDFTAVCLR
jgi:hypothetical protein